MRSEKQRLKDILHSIGSIEHYYDSKRYFSDEPYRHGMVRYLEIIGEASRALKQETRDLDETINWKLIIGFRNIVIHQYHDLDWETVQNILENHIPKLKKQIENLLTKAVN